MMGSSYPLPVVEAPTPEALISRCPYRNKDSVYCAASVVRAAISTRQNAAYCSTENFDSCPVYLGKILRGTCSRPLP